MKRSRNRRFSNGTWTGRTPSQITSIHVLLKRDEGPRLDDALAHVLDVDVVDAAGGMTPDMDARLELAAVLDVWELLSWEHREVLELRATGHTLREIGVTMRRVHETVRLRESAAIRSLSWLVSSRVGWCRSR